jgi:glycosyltransferase involved in cell wall biosynthesis
MSENLEILMPAHNEAESLSKLIPEIDNNIKGKIDYSMIICEDGSTDDTLNVIEEFKKNYPIKLISSKNKKGYSIAVLDGIKSATADYLLIMDSDGQSNPEEIINFWNCRTKANLVNGHRANRKDYMYRRLYSKLALLVYKLLFNIPVKDPSYAFIMMDKKVCNLLNDFKPEMPDGFFWEFNARAKYKRFSFYNLDIIHNERYFGETRIYHWSKLPMVSYNNLLGMIKIKLFN